MSDGLSMMPWYPRDFIAATLGWRLLERGLYLCLLFASWELGSLPPDTEELALIAGATESEFSAAWPRVSKKFEANASGRLFNRKLEEHRAKALKIRSERAAAGKIGGLASANSRSKPQANSEANVQANASANVKQHTQANGIAKFNPPSPSPSPSPIKTQKGGGGRRVPPGFEPDRQFALAELPDVDLETEIAKFRDWEYKNPRSDWPACWRTWIRNAKADGKYARNQKDKITWR